TATCATHPTERSSRRRAASASAFTRPATGAARDRSGRSPITIDPIRKRSVSRIVVPSFDATGCIRSPDGITRYDARPVSLVEMLRRSVGRVPGEPALVELGGSRITYRALWDRAARVAGGLRAAGVAGGDRVAIRLGNGIDWCLAFFGIQLAGAIAVPV